MSSDPAGSAATLSALPYPGEPGSTTEIVSRDHLVTAVLVAHDGVRWLPAALSTLAALERLPDVLVAVDTGSTDGSFDLLRDALGEEYVVSAGRDEGFGAAVERGLERAVALAPATALRDDGLVRWVWLLHDDCAPLPEALAALLDSSDEVPTAGVLGPKLRGWHDRRLLLEAGITVTGSGRRETGLEKHESDQGQHDGLREVLAVSSAGMLVRRELWELLDGFDPALPIFRDDIDFCWRAREYGARVFIATDAVLHHAEAAARGRRTLDAVVNRPHLVDRAHGLYSAFCHTPGWRLPLTTIRHIVGTVLRAIGFLLAKSPRDARDDLVALGLVLLRPDRVLTGRSRVRRTRKLPPREVRAFLAPPGHALRHGLEALGGILTTGRGQESAVGSALESGPTGEDAEFLQSRGVRRVVTRPAILLTLGLLAVTIVASRGSLGLGVRSGGALLPTPDSAASLWQSYLASWHDVGPGSNVPAPPYLAILALLAALFLGHAAWLVTALLTAGPAIAGLSAYLSLRGISKSRWVRVWAGAAYALLPATLGAVVTGRLGTLMLAIFLPLIARTVSRAVRGPKGTGSWRATWSAALLLSVVAAFVPGLLVAAPALALAVGAAIARTRLTWSRLLALSLMPILLLLPWSAWVLTHPANLAFEAGLRSGPGMSDPRLQGFHVLLVHPGGAGMTPSWTVLGLLAAALLAGFRRDTRAVVLGCWVVIAVSLTLALVQSRLRVVPFSAQSVVVAWPGPATLVIGAALILAAVVVVQGLRTQMNRASFGLSQPATVVVLAMCLAAPVSAATWWGVNAPVVTVSGAHDPVPAFVSVQSGPPDRPRSLVLGRVLGGRIGYALVAGSGPTIGAGELLPAASTTTALDDAVSGIVSGRSGSDAATLISYGIRYVMISDPSDTLLVGELDSAPGIRRIAANDGSAIWVLNPSPSRFYIQNPDGSRVSIASSQTGSSATIPAATPTPRGSTTSTGTRLLVLSSPLDAAWWASVNSLPLTPTVVAGWGQAFVLPATGGELAVGYNDDARRGTLLLQAFLLLVVVVLALPRRRKESVDPDTDVLGGEEPRHLLAAARHHHSGSAADDDSALRDPEAMA